MDYDSGHRNGITISAPAFDNRKCVHDDEDRDVKDTIGSEASETRFVRLANVFFRRFGTAIARRPWTSLAVSTIITVITASIIPYTEMSNDVSDFTPNGARARREMEAYKEFFANKGEPIALFVLVRARGPHGGNMLGVRQLEETVRLLDMISTRFTVYNAQTDRNETFTTLCNSFCTINEPIRHFYNGLLIKRNFGQNVTADHIDLGYPITTVLGRQLHMDPNFFGVKSEKHSNKKDIVEDELHIGKNHHLQSANEERIVSVNELRSSTGHSIFDSTGAAQLKDNIREIRVIGLQFRVERPSAITPQQLRDWQFRIVHYLQSEFTSEFVEAYMLSEGFLTAEVVRAGLTLLPFLVIGFVIMVVFSAISMNAAAFYASQLYPHKSLLAVVACACPFMACGTSLGLLFWAGFRFGSILCVTPFLVLALGVDDAFLMLNSWQRFRQKQMKRRTRWAGKLPNASPTSRALASKAAAERAATCQQRVEELLSAVMIDTGASITITTLTNALAFSIGALTPTPEIQLFSIGNTVAIIIDFIFEWTIFGAALAIVGRWELEADDAFEDECEFLPTNGINSHYPIHHHQHHNNDDDLTNKHHIQEHFNRVKRHQHYQHYLANHSTRVHSKSHELVARRDALCHATMSREKYSFSESLHVIARCLHAKLDDVVPRFVRWYCSLIANAYVASGVLLALVVYMYISVYGVLNIRAELKPEQLFLQTSDVIQALEMRNDFIIPFYAICIVFVNQPGNLSDPLQVRRLYSLVSDFERLPSSVGQFSTKFWLRDYEKFVEENAGGSSIGGLHFTNEIRQFLDWPEFQFWRGFLQLEDSAHDSTNRSSSTLGMLSSSNELHVRRFFFTTASYGPRLREWSQREKLLNQWRSVADYYPELNVSVYEDDAKFLDLIPAMVPQTAQSSFWTLACMFGVCLLFIRHPTTLLVANFAIFSCCVGVFGILSLSGIDLDPIVMSSMIMSIGFSVDIPAHISYHFYKSGLRHGSNRHDIIEPSVEDRLRHCIAAIGFPILEAGLSTIVCVSSLLLIDLHMARVFATTMILVVAIGLVHGLFVIPAIFYLISRLPTSFPTQWSPSGSSSTTSKSSPSSRISTVSRKSDTNPPPPPFHLSPAPPPLAPAQPRDASDSQGDASCRSSLSSDASSSASFTKSSPDGILSIRLCI